MKTRNLSNLVAVRFTRPRRGMAALIAMLYLVLFSVMAMGFYAAVTTSAQISHSDQRITKAYLAAESGMDFMRYQLARVSIPPTTEPSGVLDELYADLVALNDTPNFAGKPIAKVGNTIRIPADPSHRVSTDNEGGFRATITDWAGEIVVKIEGRHGSTNVGRAFTMDFSRVEKNSSVFDYAVASKGRVMMKKGSITGVSGVSNDTIAQVMSAKGVAGAITMTGGAIGSVNGGQLNVVIPEPPAAPLTADDLVDISGGTVHGASGESTILSQYTKEVPAPEFPTVDTEYFKPYATTTYSSGMTTMKNVRIPAGTGTQASPLKFTGGATIQGVLYIESPNVVEFRGNTVLQGFIVFENAGSTTTNVIDQRGNFSHLPLPSGPEFDALRATSGVAMLAPTTSLTISGSVDSSLKGNLILGTFNNAGSADVTIERGTLMTLDDTVDSAVFNGKTVKFASTGAPTLPNGVLTYSSYFQPDPKSYQEVAP